MVMRFLNKAQPATECVNGGRISAGHGNSGLRHPTRGLRSHSEPTVGLYSPVTPGCLIYMPEQCLLNSREKSSMSR